jgi:hypothetical protein
MKEVERKQQHKPEPDSGSKQALPPFPGSRSSWAG